MRRQPLQKAEDGRITKGEYGSEPGKDYGAFVVPSPYGGISLRVVSSGADSEHMWEHVSVSTDRRTPNWGEMAFIKSLFWDDEECVVEFHPPRSAYINCHPYTLHLWRCMDREMPTPPEYLVGPKG